jgi:uncharacterized membrane protein
MPTLPFVNVIQQTEVSMNSSVLAAAVILAAAATFAGASAPAQSADTEQCFGVAKAGGNDCKAGSHDCAGHSTMDRDPASFIVVPAGTCEKLAGGMLKSS